MNLPDTIVYIEFTLFTSQFTSVQISTASAVCLTDLIKYLISPINFPSANQTRHLISPINISEGGNLTSLITYSPNLMEIIQTKAVRKFIGLRKHIKHTYLKMIFTNPFFIHLFSLTFLLIWSSFQHQNFLVIKQTRHPLSLGLSPM